MELHVDSIKTRSSISLSTQQQSLRLKEHLFPLVREPAASRQSPALASTPPSFPGHVPLALAMPSFTSHLSQQPVPSQSPRAGQCLPDSPLPCLHSRPCPSLPICFPLPSLFHTQRPDYAQSCWTLYKGSPWLFKESLSSKAPRTRPWMGLLLPASPGRLPARAASLETRAASLCTDLPHLSVSLNVLCTCAEQRLCLTHLRVLSAWNRMGSEELVLNE